MTYRQYIKVNIQILQILTVFIIVTIFFIKNKFIIQFPEHFKITQQFLSDIAPGAILICALLGICHFLINQKLHYSLSKSTMPLNQKIFGLTFLLGCSNLLLFLKAEKLKHTQCDRFIVLLLGLSSAGGISCISLSSLGIPIYQILIASIALPSLIIVISIPISISIRNSSLSIKNLDKSTHDKSEPKKLSSYLMQYLVGASKLTANKAITIMFFEAIKGSAYKFNIDWSYLTHYPTLLFKDLGLTSMAADVITHAWIAKTLANREAALIDITNAGIYDDLSLVQQTLVLSLLINIASVSALIVIALNILSLFGMQAMQYLKILPLAFLTVNLTSIMPVIIYALFFN